VSYTPRTHPGLSVSPGALPPVHLTTRDLADRWDVSVGHLQNLRSARTGPTWLKIGARVLYPLAVIESYEAARLVRGDAA
jgi:hypothetical protein